MSEQTITSASDEPATESPAEETTARRRLEDLPPAAQRALAEAEARRAQAQAAERERRREIGGRGGKDPARYGDWEVKGIAVDF